MLTRQERHTVLVGRQPACRHRRTTPAQPPCLRSHSWSRQGSERRSRAVCGRLDQPLQPGRERGAAGARPHGHTALRAHGPAGTRPHGHTAPRARHAHPGEAEGSPGAAPARTGHCEHEASAIDPQRGCQHPAPAPWASVQPMRSVGSQPGARTPRPAVHTCSSLPLFLAGTPAGKPRLTVVPGYVFSRCRAEGGCVTRSPGVRITTQVQQSRMPACHS